MALIQNINTERLWEQKKNPGKILLCYTEQLNL